MYAKPGLYKFYSILVLIFAILSLVGGAVTGALLISGSTTASELSLPTVASAIGYGIISIISGIVSFFFCYVEFTSMYTFADMVQHELSGEKTPYRKKDFVLPAKFYKVFGSVLFYVPVIVAIIVAALYLLGNLFGSFFTMIVIPIPLVIAAIVGLFLLYIVYYLRYTTFGDLLAIKSLGDTPKNINAIKESKPNMLRLFCNILYFASIAILVGTVISFFFIAPALAGIVGVFLTILICIGMAIGAVILVILLGIIGCFFDNMAMMIEHYMIEYKLLRV